MKKGSILEICIRYSVLLLISIVGLNAIYAVFTPLTVYSSYSIMSIIDPSSSLISSNVIYFNGDYAELIPACIAGSAYLLLLILNLSTPMSYSKRMYSLIFSLASFFIFNVLRIALFAYLYTEGYRYFNFTHLLTWYFGSTLLIVIVWFSSVHLFKISSTPVYSDICLIISKIKKHRRTK